VVAAAVGRGLDIHEATDFGAEPGRGAVATVARRRVHVARPDVLDDLPASQAAAAARLAVGEADALGRTAVVVVADHRPVGLGIGDQLRPDALAAVTRLAELTGAAPVLLTGDNQRAAAALTAEVGILDVRASLLPAQKMAAVNQLQSDGARLGLVGDGINDAPALAAAHLGVAMGRHGSDLALETADVIVVRDELAALPAAFTISRHARRVVKANLAFAALVIATLVSIDLAGHLPFPLGVAGHEGSIVVVGLDGLRLLRRRHWRP
jgi:cation transport ATPase